MIRRLWLIVLLVVLIPIMMAVSACNVPGLQSTPAVPTSKPLVTLSSPEAGQIFQAGSEIKVQSTAVDEEGVARVELLVNGEVVRIDANAHPQPGTPFLVAQPWTPEVPGSYVIQVRVYSTAQGATETEPVTIEVSGAAQAAGVPASPTLSIEAGTPGGSEPGNLAELPAVETPAAAATAAPTLSAATPTATPTPGTFTPTGIEPQGRFYDIWQDLDGGESRLGYPTGPAITNRNYAKQYFERGLMYWWDSPEGDDFIWIIDSPEPDLNSGKSWNRYIDTWESQDPFACDEARGNGEKGPMRGFGQLWCSQPELRQRLGNPWEREAGSAGQPPFSQVQFFQGGVILYNPINAEVYVLFDQGDWLRFGY